MAYKIVRVQNNRLQNGALAGLQLLDRPRLPPLTGTLHRGDRLLEVGEASFLKFREDQHRVDLHFERTGPPNSPRHHSPRHLLPDEAR